jgi:hypothetical protein
MLQCGFGSYYYVACSRVVGELHAVMMLIWLHAAVLDCPWSHALRPIGNCLGNLLQLEFTQLSRLPIALVGLPRLSVV